MMKNLTIESIGLLIDTTLGDYVSIECSDRYLSMRGKLLLDTTISAHVAPDGGITTSRGAETPFSIRRWKPTARFNEGEYNLRRSADYFSLRRWMTTPRYDSWRQLRDRARENLFLAARIHRSRYDVGGLLSNPTRPDLLLATPQPTSL